jgi:hypothetical protein
MYTMLENGLITSTAGGTFVYGSFTAETALLLSSAGRYRRHDPPRAGGATSASACASYTPETPPTEDGERLIHVYIGTESIVVFKAVGGLAMWTEERVMTAPRCRTKELTPRGTFHIVRQYVYKRCARSPEKTSIRICQPHLRQLSVPFRSTSAANRARDSGEKR